MTSSSSLPAFSAISISHTVLTILLIATKLIYRDLIDARTSIREFLEKIYIHKRLHSALGYVAPARFEKEAATRQLSV